MHERWEVADFLASAEVFRTGGSARADAPRWESAEGETAERLRSLGIVSTVRVRPERAGKAVAQHQLIVGGRRAGYDAPASDCTLSAPGFREGASYALCLEPNRERRTRRHAGILPSDEASIGDDPLSRLEFGADPIRGRPLRRTARACLRSRPLTPPWRSGARARNMGDAGLGHASRSRRCRLASHPTCLPRRTAQHMRVLLRIRLGKGQLGELMNGFYCLSVWVAAPASLAVARRPRELPKSCSRSRAPPACSSARRANVRRPSLRSSTGKEWEDELLWKEAEGAQGEHAHAR